ncbi:MAG: HAD family phosphatase [Elusimicrobia bacterium]|nr:HAD family phosphatase [Elusimicrobiota bacterium]
MKEKVIIFDLGKVIFDYDIDKMARGFLAYSKEEKPDFTSIYPATFLYEKGQISSKEYYNEVVKNLSLENFSFEEFSEIWNEIFTVNEDVVKIIKEISNKNNIALLSNTNELHFEYLYNLNKDFFDKCFKKLHLSYKMDTRKPEKEIYKKVIDFHNVSPENIFFTDDVSANIEMAKEQGINAFLFEGADKLKKDLQSFGIEQ